MVVVFVLVTVSNSCILPVLPISLAVEPAVNDVPVIVNVAVVPTLVPTFVGVTLETTGPLLFILLLNTFLRAAAEVSYIIVKSASFAVSDNSV